MIAEKDFYLPYEIVPTIYQLETFVLPHLDDLRLGCWPPDHRITGYVDDGKSSSRNCSAPFLNAAELAAEIDDRMSKIVDSIALILRYTANWSIERIAQSLHYDEEDLEHEMKLMLKYVAGRKRKRQTYLDYKRDLRRRKTTLNVVSNTGSVDKVLSLLH